jgi:DmsE family decaheme c-type cytochrome
VRRTARFGRTAAGVVATLARLVAGVEVAALLACAAHAADGPPTPTPAKLSASAYSAKGADTCLGCHTTPNIVGIFRTKHAQPNDDRGPFSHGGLQCEACHGPGGAHVAAGGGPAAGMIVFGAKSATPVAQQNATCLGCHQSNAAHDWAASAHAANDVACASCHSSHQAKDPMSAATTQIDVCVGCHQTQRTALFKPSHHPLREGKMSCTSCHSPHGSSAPAALVKNTITETCTSCHTELRGPFLWEHQPVAENCANCHEPHGSTQPAMLTLRPPFLCQTCHEGAGHPSIVNTPQGLPGGKSPSSFLVGSGCVNCHSQVHGSNHPSGRALMR